MKPTVGQIVFYKATSRDTEPVAAIICAVHIGSVDLSVIRPGNTEFVFVRNAVQAESFEKAVANQWAWPERV